MSCILESRGCHLRAWHHPYILNGTCAGFWCLSRPREYYGARWDQKWVAKPIKTNWILLYIGLGASEERGHHRRNTVPPPHSGELHRVHESDWESPFNNELRRSSLEGIRMCKTSAKSLNDRSDFKFSNSFKKGLHCQTLQILSRVTSFSVKCSLMILLKTGLERTDIGKDEEQLLCNWTCHCHSLMA